MPYAMVKTMTRDEPNAGMAGSRSPDESKSEARSTPMMAQYFEIKNAHPDSLLFFRMGDFYEMFFDDAVAAAGVLNIALTKRGKHDGADVPMCGVPVHSHQAYLQRLIKEGFRVAICEQTEDPAEARRRGGKALVKRAVDRLVTPGTLTEDTLLDARSNNHLAAVARAGGEIALAWIDISTGVFWVTVPAQGDLAATLSQISPGELLVPDSLVEDSLLGTSLMDWRALLTPLPATRFDSIAGERRLKRTFRVASLDAFGAFGRAEWAACGGLLDYVALTQKGRMPRLLPPRQQMATAVMAIDAATRRNLEITAALDGGREMSLLGVIDRTLTGAGARLLAARLTAPLTDPMVIAARLDMVQWFFTERDFREQTRQTLRACPDIERALSRLTLDRGGPRDLAAIRDAITRARELKELLAVGGKSGLPDELRSVCAGFGDNDVLIERLTQSLGKDLPLLARDGGFIASGYATDLDEQIMARDESRRLIRDLEKRYREETGIGVLKLKHNNVLGYFVEVTPAHANKMTGPFIHRQTLASSVRFTTVELGDLEDKISRAGERALALELELFGKLVDEVCGQDEALALTAETLAQIDVAAGLAELAAARGYVRPIVDDSYTFRVSDGRHPVVEAVGDMRTEAQSFIANDCDLSDEQRLWLLTGPNMAGKSTFLRQNALIALLGQMGSFVPARAAHIGIVDRLFSRVGAADNLARGRSTFMVEMVETAAILNQAGPRALVVLDEIGRGTATYDGLSIAWATVEYLHTHNCCRALFATHFHELTALAPKLESLSCHHMRIREWRDEVVFLYEVGPGAADRSYGIQVARLAGLPASVLARAKEVLVALESDERGSEAARLTEDLPLFSTSFSAVELPEIDSLVAQIKAIEPDSLSPREALEILYKLKQIGE